MSKPKIELTFGDKVKRTKSEQLASILEEAGWQRRGGIDIDKLAKEAIAEKEIEELTVDEKPKKGKKK